MNHPAIARRSLLTAAGCALLRPAAASSGHERLQNKTYAADIIVIGFGAAGASAAIEAARAGSSVLVLEKSPQKSHCSSTRMSSGIYLCPDRGISEEVLAQYIASTYLPDGGVSYREGKMDPDLTALARIWAKLGPQTFEWLHSLDPDFRQATSALFTTPRFMSLWEGYRPHLQGLIATYGRWKGFQHSTFGSPKLETSGGEALYACLNEGIRSASGISIRYAFQATELIADGDAVIGVRAVSENTEHQFLARQAVILTCGGFAFNRTMRGSLLPASGNQFWAASSAPENTGDGIGMGLRAGAALIASCSYFDRFCALLPQKYNGIRLGVPLSCIGSPHSILVDNFGRRFTSESELRDQEQHYGFYQEMLQFDPATLSFPRAPVWLIFDHALMLNGPLATLGEGSTVSGLTTWSEDNLEAVRKGWILTGETITELAQSIARHPDNASRLSAELLQKSISHFNRAAQSGFDEQFDRDPSTLEPIAQAPFYAMPVSIDVPHMGAGLKTDRNKQVLRWDNTPIEGLYAAGETAPVSQFVHDRGGHLSECLVFGRHVGRIAAALPKRGRQ